MTPTCIHKYLHTVQRKLSMRRDWTKQLLADFDCNSSDKGNIIVDWYCLESLRKSLTALYEDLRVDKLDVTITKRDWCLWQGLWNVNREVKLIELSSLLPSSEPPQLPIVPIVCEPQFWSNHDDSSVQTENLTVIPLCSSDHRHSYATQDSICPITKQQLLQTLPPENV